MPLFRTVKALSNRTQRGDGSRQRGSFILLTLIIISLLTTVSVIGLQSTIQNTRLINSYQSYQLAMHRAQTAITQAMKQLGSVKVFAINPINVPVVKGMFPQLINANGSQMSAWRYIKSKNLWWNDALALQHKDSQGRYVSSYIVEKLIYESSDKKVQYFRVTAIGIGFSQSQSVVIQSIVCIGDKLRRLSWQRVV